MDISELMAIFGPGVAGAVFGAGWWFWVDAVVCSSVKVSFLHYLPGIFASLAALMFNCVRREDIDYSPYEEGEWRESTYNRYKPVNQDSFWLQVARQPLFVKDAAAYMMDVILPGNIPSIAPQPAESAIQKIVEANHSSRAGIFSMEDALVDQDHHADYKDVKNMYKTFKKFDSVVDHSDHFFSAQNSAMNQLPKWAKRIRKERKILKKQLPGTIYVRVYESRIDLLRAVIVGPEGTPYHNGLFFFDVCFPSNYPNSPPNFEGFVLGHFCSRARDILLSCNKTSCSTTFKNDMDSAINDLITAFRKIKAKKWDVLYSTNKKNQVIVKGIGDGEREYTDDDLDQIREEWAQYVANFIFRS